MLSLGLAVACFALALHGGSIGSSDGISMYEVAKSLVSRGDVAIDRGVVWHGSDGRLYSPFGIGLSLVAVIPYGAVTLARYVHPVPDAAAVAAVASLTPLIFACLTVATYGLARRLAGSVRASVVVALAAVGATFIVVYGKAFFSEPLAALCVVVGIERALAKRWCSSGAALAAAAITRPQVFAVAPLLLWRIWRDGGWAATARASAPLAFGLLVDVIYNIIRFADPLNFGYSTPELQQGFTTPLLEGAAGLLFNPEKSVLLFAPLVALIPFGLGRLWRRERTAFWLLGGNLAITFGLSATWWAWGGGWVWGPRLLIPGLVPAIASISTWAEGGRARAAVLATLVLFGAALNAPGALVDVGAQLTDRPRPVEGPRIDRQLALVPDAVGYTAEHLFDRSGIDRSRYLDLWQVKAAREWGPRGWIAALVTTGVLMGGGAVSLIILVMVVGSCQPSRGAAGEI